MLCMVLPVVRRPRRDNLPPVATPPEGCRGGEANLTSGGVVRVRPQAVRQLGPERALWTPELVRGLCAGSAPNELGRPERILIGIAHVRASLEHPNG